MWIQKMSRNFAVLSIPVIASTFLFSCSGGLGLDFSKTKMELPKPLQERIL